VISGERPYVLKRAAKIYSLPLRFFSSVARDLFIVPSLAYTVYTLTDALYTCSTKDELSPVTIGSAVEELPRKAVSCSERTPSRRRSSPLVCVLSVRKPVLLEDVTVVVIGTFYGGDRSELGSVSVTASFVVRRRLPVPLTFPFVIGGDGPNRARNKIHQELSARWWSSLIHTW
jgi:hypothetical protein